MLEIIDDMSVNWSDKEVFHLLDCWSEEGIQEQLEGSRRNKHVYEKLSRSLAESYNIEKTGEQCRTKVKKLHQEYKKIKDGHNLTGHGRTQWKYYDKLDKILGSRSATRPRVLLETLESQPKEPSSDETNIGDLEDDYNNSHSSTSAADGGISDNLDGSEPSGSVTASVSGTPSRHSGHSDSQESEDVDKRGGSGIKGKKRKRSKGEVLENVMIKVVKTMTDGMKSSDKMFTELEEKRGT